MYHSASLYVIIVLESLVKPWQLRFRRELRLQELADVMVQIQQPLVRPLPAQPVVAPLIRRPQGAQG